MGRKETEREIKKLVFFSGEKSPSLEGNSFHCNTFAMEQAVVKKPWAENPALRAHSKPTQDGSHLGPDISLLGTLCHTSQVWWCQTHRAQLCTTSCCAGECRRQGGKRAVGVSGATDVKALGRRWHGTGCWACQRLRRWAKETKTKHKAVFTQAGLYSMLSGKSSPERSRRPWIARDRPHRHSGKHSLLGR